MTMWNEEDKTLRVEYNNGNVHHFADWGELVQYLEDIREQTAGELVLELDAFNQVRWNGEVVGIVKRNWQRVIARFISR